MRILLVDRCFVPSREDLGGFVKIRGFARALAHREHSVHLLTSHFPGAHPEDRMEGEPFGVTELFSLLRYRTTAFSPGIFRWRKRWLRDFDLIHALGFYDFLSPYLAPYARRQGIPVLLEPMGMFVPRYRSLRIKRFYHRRWGRRLLDAASFLVATSEMEREEILGMGFPPERVVVRRNGIDTPPPALAQSRGSFRARAGIPADRLLVMFLGRITEKKQPDLLARAFRAASVPGSHLAVVGPVEDRPLAHLLQKIAAQPGAPITLHDAEYGNGKWEALGDADLFALPSRNENFANAAGEALVAGTPVLLSDQCGIATQLDTPALRTCPPTEEDFVRSLRTLLALPSLRMDLRAAASATAPRLTWDEPVAQMEALYRRALREITGGPAGIRGPGAPPAASPPPGRPPDGR